MTRRAYDPGLPIYASWSLESPVYTCMLALQVEGNETRIVGSKHWENAALSDCMHAMRELFPWRSFDTHVIPQDNQLMWQPIMERFGWYVEQAPQLRDSLTITRELMTTLKIDNVAREWTEDQLNNQDFIDAIGQYAPRAMPQYQGFNVTVQHNLPTFFTRALEVFAAWRHIGNARPGSRNRRPDYRLHDRAVV